MIALLIAAQTDMRWTTSPRLSLELALIRATIPETDAAPEALVSRLERLERVAGITGSGGAAVSGSYSPPPSRETTAPASRGGGSQSPATATSAPPAAATPTATDEAAVAGEPAAAGTGNAADPSPRGSAKRKRPQNGAQRAAPKRPRPSVRGGTRPCQASGPVVGCGTSAVD